MWCHTIRTTQEGRCEFPGSEMLIVLLWGLGALNLIHRRFAGPPQVCCSSSIWYDDDPQGRHTTPHAESQDGYGLWSAWSTFKIKGRSNASQGCYARITTVALFLNEEQQLRLDDWMLKLSHIQGFKNTAHLKSQKILPPRVSFDILSLSPL